MASDCMITLIAEIDEETEESDEVFATLKDVGQNEFFAAAQKGFKAEFVAEIWRCEYEGQPFVELCCYDGVTRRFSIYRTYTRPDEKIELYLTQATGVFNGN